jgi:hypothetical protein
MELMRDKIKYEMCNAEIGFTLCYENSFNLNSEQIINKQ